MTNKQIIFNERLQLMESGSIGNTGRKIILENEDGKRKRFSSRKKYIPTGDGKNGIDKSKRARKPLLLSRYGNTQ